MDTGSRTYREKKHDDANKWSDAALEKIREFRIEPSPRNYAVWFDFVSESNPALKHALDRRLADGEEITDELCDEIFRQFSSHEKESALIRETSERVQATFADVIVNIDEVASGTRKFSTELQSFSDRAQLADTGSLQKLVENMQGETCEMSEKTQALDVSLQSASLEIQDLKRRLDDARREALTDGLTGIPNRRFLDLRLDEITGESLGRNAELSIIMIDIDHFKAFNDNHGHHTGDQVLKLVARTLAESIRGRDVVVRYGGEEFCALLPDTALENAKLVADNIRRSVAHKNLVRRSSGEEIGRITVSLGVAAFKPGEPASQFLQRADEAMYEAKNRGRNTIVAEDALYPHVKLTT